MFDWLSDCGPTLISFVLLQCVCVEAMCTSGLQQPGRALCPLEVLHSGSENGVRSRVKLPQRDAVSYKGHYFHDKDC